MLENKGAKKHIWIYGAGIVANRLLQTIEKPIHTLSVSGIVVSHKQDESKLGNYEIFDIKEIDSPKEETLFLIAVSKKYHDEVIEQLRLAGYENYWIYNYENICEPLIDVRFEDRRKHMSKVCFVLCGYKEFLWKDVFGRLIRFAPADVEVCLLSSGLYSDVVALIAEKQGWSYLSVGGNSVSYIQNLALEIYDDAEWIYKMDEDIFVTDGCFEKMYDTYQSVSEPYQIGFVGPLIPVNGYGYIRILDQLQKRDVYESKFDQVLFGCHPNKKIENSEEACKFMWGVGGDIPRLDTLNKMFSEKNRYSFCNIRFSIGFILYKRELWEAMGKFNVSGYFDLGGDESDLCHYCMIDAHAIVVAENTVVGHFSFGQQTKKMKEYYLEDSSIFAICEE